MGALQEIRDYIFHVHGFHIEGLSDVIKKYNNFKMPISKRQELIKSSEEECNKFINWYHRYKINEKNNKPWNK